MTRTSSAYDASCAYPSMWQRRCVGGEGEEGGGGGEQGRGGGDEEGEGGGDEEGEGGGEMRREGGMRGW